MQKKLLLFTILPLLFFPVYAWENNLNSNKTVVEDANGESSFILYSQTFYQELNDPDLNFEAFQYGLNGFLKLKEENKLSNTKYLTIIDMSLSSSEERFYLINTETKSIEHKSLVAHGRNSGDEFATLFSNKTNSHQSSLGFYRTAETYMGSNGFSLRLDGMEFSNSNARKRAIVIHQADYVSRDYISRNGRLGRSYGCPALPQKDYRTIISKIKEGTCLFIYYPAASYLSKSNLVNTEASLLAIAD